MSLALRKVALLILAAQDHKLHSDEVRRQLLRDSGLLGTQWRHYKNGHAYEITGFSWNGDTDQWCVEYRREGSLFRYNRTFENAFGYAAPGVWRFEEVLP